jgi:exonuclease III
MSDATQQQRLIQARTEWNRMFASTTTDHNDNPTHSARPSNSIITLSTLNMQNNTHWGDQINQQKPENTTRIYCQNVNGFKLDKEGGQYSIFCKIHQEIQADISCCQEINLDTTQHQVKTIMHKTTQRHWKRSRLTIGSTPIAFTGQYKPGGTMVLSTDSITGRIHSAGTDKWGRWTHHSLLGHNGRKLIVISAYQPIAMTHENRGSYTVAAQQRCLLLQSNDPIDNPRRAFRRDLKVFISTQLERQSETDILLLGDFNERLGEDPNGLSNITAHFQLVDILTTRHPTCESPATYARGHKRLDYALGTHRVAASIIAGGYEPFNYRFHTDHRAFYLDFNTHLLFGSPTQQLSRSVARGLQAKNVIQITKYISEKHRMLSECNAFERAKRLEFPGNRHRFAEKLDADIVQRSLSAERRTSKYGAPMWSLKLIAARRKVSILSKLLSMHKTGIDLTEILNAEMASLQHSFLLPATTHECNIMLRLAKREVAHIIATSFEVRDDERAKQIEELEADPDPMNKKKAKILRNLKKAEEMKQLFQKLQLLRNVRQSSGITRIEVPVDPDQDPKTCNDWKTIDVPTDILQHLQTRNRQHFGQAKDTPFTTQPLSDDLGFTGDTESASAILQGTYDIPDALAPTVQLLIAHLKRGAEFTLSSQRPYIQDDEYVDKLKSWSETTSTSPSGLHLGHYKALIVRHAYSDLHQDDPERTKWDTMQQDLRSIHLTLMNYALQRGYSFIRWQQVVNAMLFKEEGNIKIHRTRVIHLYEADYNLAIGLQWRSALYQSEDFRQLNQGQYGSRPHRNAHDPIFIEEFQLEISRATRKSLLQTNYDATSCYDRIIPSLASIVSRKFGVPDTVVLSNMTTLLHAKYKLKTELGLSNEFYQHTDEYPIYGTGQGSGNSPMIWCFLSSVLFDCYETLANGAVYELPDRSGHTKLYMVGYVDDSNGQTNSFIDNSQPDDAEILTKACHDAQSWHDVLAASGGALELSKCSYQLISWTFAKDGTPYMKLTPPDTQVNVVSADNHQDACKQLAGRCGVKLRLLWMNFQQNCRRRLYDKLSSRYGLQYDLNLGWLQQVSG